MFSYPVILIGGYCYELRLDKLKCLHVAAATTECDVRSGRCTNGDVKTRLILMH